MGQLSDPYEQGEDDGIDLEISGLPKEPDQPEDVMNAGPDEPDGDFDDDNDVVRDAEAVDDLEEDDRGLEDAEDDELDPDDEAEEIAYELEGWDNDQLDALFDALDEAGIAYLWDGDELFVNETDEQAVDEVLEKVAHPHQLAADDEDGDGGGWLLGELFVVADRLLHDPEEHESVARLLQLATTAEESEPPYGLGDPEWDGLREKVTALATILEAAQPDADEALEAARELRSAVRPYV